MAEWKNNSVFLRSFTEIVKGNYDIDLSNYDNGVAFENPKISAYGCAISTKNDKRTYSNVITKLNDTVYNIQTKSKIIKPKIITNYNLGSYSDNGDLKYVRGSIHASGVLVGLTGASFVGSYGYYFNLIINPFGRFRIKVDKPFDWGYASIYENPSNTVSSFAEHISYSWDDYNCATPFNLYIEFYYPSATSLNISLSSTSISGYGSMGSSASKFIKLRDFSCKLTSLAYENIAQTTEAEADTLVLVTEELKEE